MGFDERMDVQTDTSYRHKPIPADGVHTYIQAPNPSTPTLEDQEPVPVELLAQRHPVGPGQGQLPFLGPAVFPVATHFHYAWLAGCCWGCWGGGVAVLKCVADVLEL